MRIDEVTYGKLKTPLKVNGNLKQIFEKTMVFSTNKQVHYIAMLTAKPLEVVHLSRLEKLRYSSGKTHDMYAKTNYWAS